MINNVVLAGRLTKDVELRFTANGVAVASFTLAVNRPFKNAEGENEADFINCVIWRQPAETLANHTGKGSLIGVEGSIQTRTYETEDGSKRYVTEVVANRFSFLESKKQEEPSKPANKPQQKGGYNKSYSKR